MTKQIKDKKLTSIPEKHATQEHKTTHPGYQGTQKKAAQINSSTKEKTEHRSGNHLDEEEYNNRK
jgi:hypothetical protein